MKKTVCLFLSLLLALLTLCACTPAEVEETSYASISGNVDYEEFLQARMPDVGEEIAVITTNYGVMKMIFFPEQAPKAVENFKGLANQGYYDDTISHRIITDFMMQAGDPTGTGTGGESVWGGKFEDEFSSDLYMIRGTVAMANAGTNTNGSQFFIVQGGKGVSAQSILEQITGWPDSYSDADKLSYAKYVLSTNYGITSGTAKARIYEKFGGAPWLDGKHTVFGQVFEGLDVLDRIMEAAASKSGTPNTTVRILSVEIVKYEGN